MAATRRRTRTRRLARAIANQPPGLLIWVAMPNGAIRTDTSTQLRLSVMLSPRLLTSSTSATVDGGEFPHFDDWPATAAGLAFNVEIDETPRTVLNATFDILQLDSAAWKALFSGLNVDSYVPTAPGLASRTFSTYNVRTNYSNVVGGYETAPGPQATEPISAPASRRAARLRLARTLGAPADEDRRLRARIDQLRERHGVVTAARIAEVPGVNTDALHFAELSSFFDGLNTGVRNRVGTAPANSPVFDFHQAITAVARYPVLMRKLGLVLDLSATVDTATIASLPAQGRIRVVLSTPVSGWQSFAPWTTYSLDPTTGGFFTTPASDALGVAAGMLVPIDTDTALVLDLDAVAPKVRTAVADFANSMTGAQDIKLPAPRSGGLALARDELAATLQRMLGNQAQLEEDLSKALDAMADPNPDTPRPHVILKTEDLLRGFRVDIRRDGDDRWLSLNQRNGRYTLANGAGLSFSIVDEGFISLQAFNPDKDSLPVLYAHETLFRWTGWSLSVPRPGKTIGSDGKPIPRNEQATSNVPITVDFKPVPNTLPRLRFGAGYDCRLRAVDLAGNSLPQNAETLEDFTFRLGKYLRFDPVIAPTLAMRDAVKPAESVNNLVMRSEIDSPAAETAERLVAPPKTSVQMAEWHGMFDTATGVDSTAYHTFVKLDGNFPDEPYGATPPALPYLPDPVARGASLRQIVPNAPPADPTKIPFDGTWPARQPFRLRLVEGSAPPTWDPAQRLFIVSLEKGRTATYELGSYMDTGSLGVDPTADDVKDLALFNYWDSIVTPRRHRPPLDRTVYWAEVTAGHNEQLTPHRRITLVHAVPRPVLAPSLDPAKVAVVRSPRSTAARIVGTTVVDLPSTGQLEIITAWDEPVDDGVNPPRRIAASAHMGRQSLDPNSVEFETSFGGHHEFHDTKHRSVICWLVASTRYGEYFPDIREPAKLTQMSAKVTVNIPCSARPLPPKVLYVVPAFGWQESVIGGTVKRERRVGLRVYLDRPWYSSGDGERLAVRMAMAPVTVYPTDGAGDRLAPGSKPFDQPNIVPSPPQDVHDADVPFVTQWGTDPAFVGNSIASPFTPLPRHFPNAKSTEFQLAFDGVTLGEPEIYKYTHATFDVTFEPPDPSDPNRSADPSRDPHNGRWYCDIEIDAGTPYFPFLRLALARFQPSGQFWDPEGLAFFDMRFSVVALVDFVQLAPGRALNIMPDATDPSLLHLTITGPSFIPNEALGNLARPRPAVIVGIEINVGETTAPLWIPVSSTEFSDPVGLSLNSGVTAWSGNVRLPFVQGSKPMRLTIKEYESLPTDRPSRDLANSTLVPRIVFAASIELLSTAYNFTTVDFPGGTSTLLLGLNNNGQMVGEQRDANGVFHSMLTDTRAFSTFDPPGFTGTSFPVISLANGINDAGEIVGGGIENNDNPGAQAYVKKGDAFSLYNHPNADPSRGTEFLGINNLGVRVGAFWDDTDTPHGIIQTGNTTTLLEDLLNVPANTGTFIFDINNLGQMVGGYFDPVQDVQHGFLADGTTFVTIDFPGSSFTWLNGINDLGQMVGGYFDDAAQGWRGFLTDGKTFTVMDFPDVPGQHPGTFLTGIDNAGRIAGYYGDDLDRLFGAGIHGFLATPVLPRTGG
jgi:uncharacterized membrane protein